MEQLPEEHRAVAAADMQARCDLLANSRAEPRAELETQAYHLGRYVGMGLLERDRVIVALMAACERNGSIGQERENADTLMLCINERLDAAASQGIPASELDDLARTGGLAQALTIDRLAQLRDTDYETVRNEEAGRLGFRVGMLDEFVARRRRERDVDDALSRIPTLEPYPNAVDGSELLDEIVTTLRRFMVMRERDAAAVALYVLYTHLFDRFYHAPRLIITSKTPGCGKTRLCTLMSYMVQRACLTSNISVAAVYRLIEMLHPCLMMDEGDAYANRNEEMRGIVNSGHARRMAFVVRFNAKRDEPEWLNTFAPMVVSLIGSMQDTVQDRSIIITLQKASKHREQVDEFHEEEHGRELKHLGQKAARWAADNARGLTTKGLIRPPAVGEAQQHNDRAWDNWAPLVAIAQRAGGRWPEYVMRVICEQALQREGAEVGAIDAEGEELLRDIRRAFGTAAALRADQLHAALIALPEGKWGNFENDARLSTNRLGRMLGALNITPRKMRDGRFYERTTFEKFWAILGTEILNK